MTSASVDVLVIGGGSAGMAAAIAAAREGARTLLVERRGTLGGMGTAALVHSFCGLYRIEPDASPVLANPGISTEMATRMLEATGQSGPTRMGRLDVLVQDPFAFGRIADEWVGETQNLSVWFHTEVIGASQVGDEWDVDVLCRGTRIVVRARALVDASGDAVLAEMLEGEAESEMTESRILQRPSYIFGLQGVDSADVADDARLRLAGVLAEAVRGGDLPREALGATFRAVPGSGKVFVTVDLGAGGSDWDATDPTCLTHVEVEGRQAAFSLAAYLQAKASGFAHSQIAVLPAQVGIRESRSWVGEARLTGEDVLAGRRFDDEVALATWPVELRETATGPKLRYPIDNRPCGIRAGCLRARDLQGIFMAGRCISADHIAQASIRVMGTCFATGQAAGQAAAQHSS